MEWVLRLDAAWLQWCSRWHTPSLDVIAVGLSAIGRGGVVWFAVALWLAICRARLRAGVCQLVLALIVTGVMTDGILKPLVHRPRPFVTLSAIHLIDLRPKTHSFPSGHASAAAAAALVLSAIVPEGRVMWWSLAALIAASRVFVGAHYPLDVIAGLILGLACAWFVIGGRDGWRLARTPRVG